ncbi:MAG TPA: thiol-disulfide isomerase [Blastocatellia bacterium]|nr:thiol-disulfide isomerase [Blastocatellia bacterium]
MKRRLSVAWTLSAGALLVLSTTSANSGAKKEVTFNRDVAPILFANCAECHRTNDIAPMSLMSYKESRPWARSIKEKVINREMPPWSPDPKYGEFTNDHRLAQKDIDTIVAWVDQGAKEGDAKDLVVPEFSSTDGWRLGKPDAVFDIGQEFKVTPGMPDTIQNFIVPTNFKEDKWVTAAEILPGNRKVVHHVIAFIQTPAMIAEFQKGQGRARALMQSEVFYRDGTLLKVKADAPVIDDGCGAPNGGSAFKRPSASEGGDAFGLFLAGYAPGKGIDVFPPGTAKKVPAGSMLVFQMHYSSYGGKFEGAQGDKTRLGLHFASKPPERSLNTVGIQNHYFKLPPRDGNHLVTACFTFDADVHLTSYMPHMHLRGKDMKYDVVYPDGRTETLLSVPKFSFNWQTMYYLKKPVFLPKGTKMIVTAHFDNSDKNKYNPDPSKAIRWGDPTYEEMMIGWMEYYVDSPSKTIRPDAAATGQR